MRAYRSGHGDRLQRLVPSVHRLLTQHSRYLDNLAGRFRYEDLFGYPSFDRNLFSVGKGIFLVPALADKLVFRAPVQVVHSVTSRVEPWSEYIRFHRPEISFPKVETHPMCQIGPANHGIDTRSNVEQVHCGCIGGPFSRRYFSACLTKSLIIDFRSSVVELVDRITPV